MIGPLIAATLSDWRSVPEISEPVVRVRCSAPCLNSSGVLSGVRQCANPCTNQPQRHLPRYLFVGQLLSRKGLRGRLSAVESPKRVGIFDAQHLLLLKSQIENVRGTQDKATGALARVRQRSLSLWIMTVGPGTPVYGTKTKSRDSAAAPRAFAFEQQQMGNWPINCCDDLGLAISARNF